MRRAGRSSSTRHANLPWILGGTGSPQVGSGYELPPNNFQQPESSECSKNSVNESRHGLTLTVRSTPVRFDWELWNSLEGIINRFVQIDHR